MRTFAVEIGFETDHPLPQEVGMEFWAEGDHFKATGAKAYRWWVKVNAGTAIRAAGTAIAAMEKILGTSGALVTDLLVSLRNEGSD